MSPHPVDPHYQSTGEWVCYTCKEPLKGSALRPVVPWEHRERPGAVVAESELPGLGTTE